MNPARFRVLLVTVLLAVQLGTVAVFVADARERAGDAMDAQARGALVELAGTAIERTKDFLDIAETPLRGTESLVATGWLDPADDDALERHFLSQLRGRGWLRAFYLARTDGSFVFAARDDDGFHTKRLYRHADASSSTLEYFDRSGKHIGHLELDEDDDPRSLPWYRTAHGEPEVVWADPHRLFPKRAPGVSAAFALPIVNGTPSEQSAVLGIDIDLDAFSRFVSTLAREEGSSAVLLDASGAVIGASNTDWFGHGVEERLPRLDDFAGTPLEALARADAEHAARGAPLELEVDGKRHLGVIRHLPETGWSLLVQVPLGGDALALGAYFSTRLRTLLGALAVLAVVATAAVFGMTVPFVRIHRDATTDTLTGALPRAEFERRLDERLKRRRRGDERLVSVALDLDGFKAINDTHGHAAGDEVLVAFVERLSRRLRRDDLIGRPGGDEFLLALTLPADADPHAVVESIRSDVVAEPVQGAAGRYRIGVTAGVACHEPDDTRATLLERADRLLIDGKVRAKNRTYAACSPVIEPTSTRFPVAA